jgi:hypothetical protein
MPPHHQTFYDTQLEVDVLISMAFANFMMVTLVCAAWGYIFH